jgi:hypothetical protein
MKVDYETLTEPQMNQRLTMAMVTTTEAMAEAGLITQAVADEWNERHACVQASKAGFLTRWLAKVFPTLPDDHLAMLIVRVVK